MINFTHLLYKTHNNLIYLVHKGTIGNMQKQIDKPQRPHVMHGHCSQSHQLPVQIQPSVIMNKKLNFFTFSFLFDRNKLFKNLL
jgi:hypothetical protein